MADSRHEGGSRPTPTDVLTRHRFLPTRTGVIEILVLFGLALAVEWLWFPDGSFDKLSPHPYWIPVILLSLQYGTADGLLAAALAIGAIYFGGWPSPGVDEDYFKFVMRTWSQPISWIIVAVVVGEVRARERSRLIELGRDLERTRAQAHSIARYAEATDAKVLELERQIVTSEAQSADGWIAALDEVAVGGATAWPTAFERCCRLAFGPAACLAVLQDGSAMVAVTRAGELPEWTPLRREEMAGLLTTVVRERRALSLLTPGDEAVLGDCALMAAPLTLGGQRAVVGALVVLTLEPSRLTRMARMRLDALAREMSHGLTAQGMAALVEKTAPSLRFEVLALARGAETIELVQGEAGSTGGRLSRLIGRS